MDSKDDIDGEIFDRFARLARDSERRKTENLASSSFSMCRDVEGDRRTALPVVFGDDDDDDPDDEEDALELAPVVDIVPRRNRESRWLNDVRSAYGGDSGVTREETVGEGNSADASRQTNPGETWAEVAATAKRTVKITARGARVTADAIKKFASRVDRGARMSLVTATSKENRSAAASNARLAGWLVMKAFLGIRMKSPRVLQCRIDIDTVRTAASRVSRVLVTAWGERQQKQSRLEQRHKEKRVEKEDDVCVVAERTSERSDPAMSMRDLFTLFDKVEDGTDDEVHADAFAELLSTQSIRPDFDTEELIRAQDLVPTPQTMVISPASVDMSRGASFGYSVSRYVDSESENENENVFVSPSRSLGRVSAMSPEAQAFVQRVEDDLGVLSRSDSDDVFSSRILSADDLALGKEVLREWFALSRHQPVPSPIVIGEDTVSLEQPGHTGDLVSSRTRAMTHALAEMALSQGNRGIAQYVFSFDTLSEEEIDEPEIDDEARSIRYVASQDDALHRTAEWLEDGVVLELEATQATEVPEDERGHIFSEVRKETVVEPDRFVDTPNLLDTLYQEVEKLRTEQEEMRKSIELEREQILAEARRVIPPTSAPSAEVAQLKEDIERLRSEQSSLRERSEHRERDLKKKIELERKKFEETLKSSLAAERMELEEEIAKSIVLERGGIEEQVHKGDEYLDSEIQQIHEELSRVKAEQERALQIADGRETSQSPLPTTPEPPIFALEAEPDVSMEWDVYQIKEDIERIKTQQSLSVMISAQQEEDIRKSLLLEKEAIEDAIRREVVRAIGAIEMQSVNATHQVQRSASRAEKLLGEAELIMKNAESRLTERERALLNSAEAVVTHMEDQLNQRERELRALTIDALAVSPFKPHSSALEASTSFAALERARTRRRLLHEVTDTFSLNEIVSQAQALAHELEFRSGE